jgi:geranylgeranyl reductase family protein
MSDNSTNQFDVIIIGAGVAGSSAAYDLANARLNVLVLEKEKLPRYKTCGGGVVLRAVNLLPFNINPVVQIKISSADVFDQENKTKFLIKRDEPVIYFVMRADFDNYILSKALEKGITVYDQYEVKEILTSANGVEIKTDSQTFSAKYVIAADGATGISMILFKLNQNIIRVPAIESEIIVDDKTFSQFKDTARFDFGFVPHGYGWVFPKKDHLSVGVAFMRKVNQSIQSWFKKYLDLLEMNQENIISSQKHGYVIPLIRGNVNCCVGRVLIAGDNLGFVDPLTAEGISYAIETGQLAARAIINNHPNYLKIVKNYTSDINIVHKEVKSARFLSEVVYGPLALRKFIFNHFGNQLSELLADVITEKKKYSEIVRNPLNYLKLFKPSNFFCGII